MTRIRPCYNPDKAEVTVGKKWYSFFVVTDETGSAADAAGHESGPIRADDLVPEASVEPTLTASATSTVDLDVVYRSAQISPPPHGYTVLKIADMLKSEHLQALPQDVKRKSIMVALEAAGVKVTDIVEDAVKRDRALDTYERVLQKRVDEVRAERAAENTRLEAEIAERVAELRARIDENNKQADSDQQEFLAWRTRKHQEEHTIADAVSHFVSENPISTTRPANPAKGDADVR